VIITCFERINDREDVSVLHSFDDLRLKLRKVLELIKIVRITTRRYKHTVHECSSSRAITELLNAIQDDYTRVNITVNYEEVEFMTRAEIFKREKYHTIFTTSLLEDIDVVEFYKSVKTHKISMGHIKRALLMICPYMWSLVSITTTKKVELFNIDDYELYSKIRDCPKDKYHEELIEFAWKPERLAMCIGEEERQHIASRWGQALTQ